MKILQVNKFWFRKGGADVYCLNLTKALEDQGHTVARFGMEHPENELSPWNQYFAAQSNYQEDKPSFRAALKFIYNREAKKKFQALVDEFQPDVIHIHNIYHQLTTSILPVARNSGARVVMTFHDYKVASPNYTMTAKGRVTEATKVHRYYRLLSSRASDESFPRRVLLMLEAYYTWCTKAYARNIDSFIAPSEFMKTKMRQYGVKKPIDHLLNFVAAQPDQTPIPYTQRDSFVLYVGRLSKEKGIETLIKAAELVPEQSFVVIGDGEDRPAQWPKNVEWLGSQAPEVVHDYMRRCRALIVPSEWYEVNTLVIPEAHAVGTWVIAANTGTIEILNNGKNGWWFEMGDAGDLAKKIQQLGTLSQTFQPFVHITKDEHLHLLESIYARGITMRTEPIYIGVPNAAQAPRT